MDKGTEKKKRIWLRVTGFVLGLAALACVLQRVFTIHDYMAYQTYEGFYEEEPHSLDAVFVGDSTMLGAWQAPLGWERFGYAIGSLSVSSMPLSAIRYVVEEAQKSQPNALYIIGLSDAKGTEISESAIHYQIDFLPLSSYRAKLTDALCDRAGIEGADRLEFYFPVVRYHSYWRSYGKDALFRQSKHLKGGIDWESFLYRTSDISENYGYTVEAASETVSLPEEKTEELQELIDYCREEQLNVLFVAIPQGVEETLEAAKVNAAAEMVEQAGFPVLNMLDMADALGLDLSEDFYNYPHINVHGAVKVMDYFGTYLQEHYDFTDKRGDPAYTDWDEAAAEYHEIVDNYLLDFELDGAPRDMSIGKPLVAKARPGEDGTTVIWIPSNEAEGYVVYRQTLDSDGTPLDWERVGETEGTQTKYTDSDAAPDTEYRYTVAPFVTQNGERVYGPIHVQGVTTEESPGGTG